MGTKKPIEPPPQKEKRSTAMLGIIIAVATLVLVLG